jgi:hypothetical protein
MKNAKNEKDSEWIEIDTGYDVIRLTAKKNKRGDLSIVFDAPDHVEINREKVLTKK